MTPPGFSEYAPARGFDDIPVELLAQLTPEQRHALQRVLERPDWSTLHPVDIRWSLPFLGKRFYVVFLAGPGRRATPRSLNKRQTQQLKAGLLAFSTVTGIGLLLLITAIALQTHRIPSSKKTVFPTAVPFKADKQSCEASGRIWREDTCLDYEHNPAF